MSDTVAWPRFWGLIEGGDCRWSITDYGPKNGSRRYLATNTSSAVSTTEWITGEQLLGEERRK